MRSRIVAGSMLTAAVVLAVFVSRHLPNTARADDQKPSSYTGVVEKDVW
jgi:hypothetical protein